MSKTVDENVEVVQEVPVAPPVVTNPELANARKQLEHCLWYRSEVVAEITEARGRGVVIMDLEAQRRTATEAVEYWSSTVHFLEKKRGRKEKPNVSGIPICPKCKRKMPLSNPNDD